MTNSFTDAQANPSAAARRAAPVPFLFGQDFGARTTSSARTFDDLEQAAAERAANAYREGFAAGQAEARAQADRNLAATMSSIARSLQTITGDLARIEADIVQASVDVAVAAAQRLTGELLRREPLAEVEALVAECLANLVTVPQLTVRLAPSSCEHAREALPRMVADAGAPQRLHIVADPALGEGDCRIEWSDGVIVRSRAEIEERIAAAVARYLAQRFSSSHSGADQ